MISQKEMLDIICTEAIEYGGLQEIPGQQHGGRTSFHEAKRGARTTEENNIGHSASESPAVSYDLRLVREADGTLTWED
jgi:hypothetical protein